MSDNNNVNNNNNNSSYDEEYEIQKELLDLFGDGVDKINLDDYEEEENRKQPQRESFDEIIQSGIRILISFVSSFILNQLLELDQLAEITALTIIIYAIWYAFDGNIRIYLKVLWSFQKNTVYFNTVLSLIDLVSTLGIYVIFQFAFQIISNLWRQSNINFSEGLVSLITVLSSLYAIYHTYKKLNSL
jgi:hypothetical protein